MKTVFTDSLVATEEEGRIFAAGLKSGDIVFFKGGLGAGKTAFIRGMCQGMGIDAPVQSPTFAIANVYTGVKATLYHFDMYRIENEDQLYNTGFYDYLDFDGVIAVEWSENIENFFSDCTYLVRIDKTGVNSRKITIEETEYAGSGN